MPVRALLKQVCHPGTPSVHHHRPQSTGAPVRWEQTIHEVLIRVPVAEGTKKKDMRLDIHPKRLSLSLHGNEVLSGDYGDKTVIVDGMYNVSMQCV